MAEKKAICKKPRKKQITEVEKLMRSSIFPPTSPDDGSTYFGGVRRSVRGQVPLKYDWCHTQDIWEMPFAAVCSSTPRKPGFVEPFQDSALGQDSTIYPVEPSAVTDADRNWLLGVSNVQPSKTNDQARAACLVKDLKFVELDGLEYAFYCTRETFALGYMRFKPNQVLNNKEVKACSLKFVVQIGEFAVQYGGIDEEEEESCVLREGDMVEIDKGSRYSIQNTLDAIGVIMVIRS